MLAPTRPLLQITIVSSGSRWRLILRGELGLGSGRDLTDAAATLAATGIAAVDLDLAAVTFMDSAGWEAVDSARAQIAAAGGTAELVAISPVVSRYLEAAGRLLRPGPPVGLS
jgi:anti-anti-sigma factor